ncbi:4-hydroxy-tetrahydrodipicolinate synthase [Halieaceae bacterium IMCC14734]|uniref:4-hydroxy-tetrahydrodipicolinate synthase n=1 Tax=Candidatus Litorirhabdus singularis TaxID=2518993 RepID=A0ABT3TIK5_9GAMM|nr:4-hydroxy-tetrahydrodipicolinate synthase [Candidatus Litorirhabdus singularis]MCX2982165.1 4-hydroxy-tetrahydrodipicolinate synthase [Candidatus Litorirhabdus singularis]
MISGSIVALITPMLDDGAVDWESLDALLDLHLAAGTGAIVAVGTTGESATLAVTEHCDVIARTVSKLAGAIPVIAGTGANSTSEAVELTAAAQRVGADACLLVTPYYNKPTQEGLYQHHKRIAEAVSIPQILYNVPGRTGVDMLPATVARLADIENIVGIKEATGDLQRGREVIDVCAGRMAVYSGDDATATELMLMGAQGNISVTANVAPALLAEVCALAIAGDTERARALDARLQPLHDVLFLESNPIPVKWAMAQQGRCGGHLRLPMTELAAQYQPQVLAALQALDLL